MPVYGLPHKQIVVLVIGADKPIDSGFKMSWGWGWGYGDGSEVCSRVWGLGLRLGLGSRRRFASREKAHTF